MEITYSNQKFICELETNSKPLLIEDIKFDNFICKAASPKYKLKYIYVEYLMYKFFSVLKYPIPDMKIMIVDNIHLEGSSHYPVGLQHKVFLASKKLLAAQELHTIPKNYPMRKNYDFLSLLQIAFFDYVFLNIDRKPENPNLLIENNIFFAIDNAQCFDYSSNYFDIETVDDLKSAILSKEDSILFHPLIKKIIKKNSNILESLPNLVFHNFMDSINDLHNVFEKSISFFDNQFGTGVDYDWYRNCLNKHYLNTKWIKKCFEIFYQDLRSCMRGL